MSTAAPPESIDGVQIIGIDCAAQPTGFGLASTRVHAGSLEVIEVTKGEGKDFHRISEKVRSWIAGDDADRPSRTLLALDAPLGWPIHLTRALHTHRAGEPLTHPHETEHEKESADPNPGNHLFRRHTDRFLADRFPGAPLDIGADRIARVARSALELLGQLRTGDGQQSSVPLLWDPSHLKHIGAIEVYPRLTLRALSGGPQKADLHYKGPEHTENRKTIVAMLRSTLTLRPDHLRPGPKKDRPFDYDHDRIDAVLCALEGFHFLLGESVGPEHPEAHRWLAGRMESPSAPSLTEIKSSEGWIWFHE